MTTTDVRGTAERFQDLAAGAAELAAEAGLPDAATRLRAELAGPPSRETTVVVAGETSRGKSCLINALVSRPGLLPEEADVATSVHIAVGHAAESTARVHFLDDPAGRPVPFAEIAAYASVDGNPGNHKRVRSVAVGLDNRLLELGLTLVDTPGAGSLEAAHADITLATLATADALLFVIDASAPLTASELSFLERATERVDTVAFILTKIDLLPDWQEILDADRELLRTRAPRYADCLVIPVSSRLKSEADRALADGDAELAQELWTESGFEAVGRLLMAEVIGRAGRVRRANTARLVLNVLARVEQVQSASLKAAQGDPSGDLREERRRYEALADVHARWRQDLQTGFQKLGVDLQSEIARHVQEISARCERTIAQAAPELLESLPGELGDAVDGRWTDLNGFVRNGADEIVSDLLLREDAQIEVDDLPMPERLTRLPDNAVAASGDAGDEGIGAALNRAWPAIGVFMTSQALLALVLGPAAPIAALGAGVFAGSAVYQHRKRETERLRNQRDARQFVRENLELIRREMTAQLHKHLIDLRRRLEGEIAARLQSRKQQLEALLNSPAAKDAAAAEDLCRRARDLAVRTEKLRADLRRAPAERADR